MIRINPRHRLAPAPAVWAGLLLLLTPTLGAQRQFSELQTLPTIEGSTVDTVLGDLDGDGDHDLLLINTGTSFLCLNDGHGNFEEATAERWPSAPVAARAAALGDVDSDGDLDIVVLTDAQSRLFLNDGSGVFSDVTGPNMPTDNGAYGVALGDVDSDGDLDVMLADAPGPNRLYLNDGSGVFSPASAGQMPTDSDRSVAVVLGDLDGDGDLDAVVGNGGWAHGVWANGIPAQNRIYRNDGAGTFVDATTLLLPPQLDPTRTLALGDVDGDGDLDLVVGNGVPCDEHANRLYLNAGNGSFSLAALNSAPRATGKVVLSDLDGDGDLDLLCVNFDQWCGYTGLNGSQNILYENDGAGGFTDITAGRLPVESTVTFSAGAADVDGDGDVDLVLGNGGPRNQLLINSGTGEFSEQRRASRLPLDVGETGALALGDVDGDGDLDLVVGHLIDANGNGPSNGANQLYLNDGRGRYLPAGTGLPSVSSGSTRDVALGDVDGDGDLDLVTANGRFAIGQSISSGGANRLFLNDGGGTFTDVTFAQMPYAPDNTNALILVDVDGDLDLDVVAGNSVGLNTPEGTQLLLNDGSGHYQNVSAARLPNLTFSTRSLAAGDFDGDGDIDLIVGGDSSMGLSAVLWMNDGSGFFSDVSSTHLPLSNGATTSLVAADLDGDGDLDIVAGTEGTNRLLWNDGAGHFTEAGSSALTATPRSTRCLNAVDLDDDGDVDLFFGNVDGDQLFLNDGNGVFTDVTSQRFPGSDSPTLATAIGDVDRDGDLDLFLGKQQHDRLLLNLLRQLDVPRPPTLGETFRLDAYSRYAPGSPLVLAIPLVALSTAQLPVASWGILGLDPSSLVALPQVLVLPPTGRGQLSLSIPQAQALVGQSFFLQALTIPSFGPIRLSNVEAVTVLQ